MSDFREMDFTNPNTFCCKCGREASIIMEQNGVKYKVCRGCARAQQEKEDAQGS